MPRNSGCTRCPLNLVTKHVCLWGVGPKQADIMLLGDAPGSDDSMFTGEVGRILNEALSDVGLSRDEIYLTNINKCKPPQGRAATTSEVNACSPYLIDEINTVKPKVIVCLGGNALKALTGKDKIRDARGKPCETVKTIRVGDAKVLATYHPAAFQHRRDNTLLAALRDDLRLAALLAGRTTTKLPKDVKTFVYPWSSVTDLVTALTGLKDCDKVAVDCEWTAGDIDDDSMHWPWTPKSELFSISISGQVDSKTIRSVAIAWPPCSEDNETEADEAKARRALQAFLGKRKLVFHNAMADLIWLISEGFDLRPHDDTQFLGYLLNEEQSLKLGQLAPLYAGVPPGWKQPLWARKPTTKPGWDELLRYNSDDTWATLLLIDAEVKLIRLRPVEEQRNLARAYRKLLVPAIRAFVDMALNGIPVNRAALKQAIIDHRAKRDAVILKLAEATGMRPPNARKLIKSPVQLKKYFNMAYGLEVEDTQAETLEVYADQYPIIALVVEEKHEEKLLSTYLEPWYEMIVAQGDDRLHFVYRLDRTRTGRTTATSEKGGSIQLAPRESWLRNLFEARPGYKLVAADQSQVELRMIAWLAPEPTMRRLFNEGADLHKITAAFIKAKRDVGMTVKQFWEVQEEWTVGVTKAERTAAKGVNFGFDFGMQVPKFIRYAKKSYQATFSEASATEARDGYFGLYDRLLPWHQRMEQMWRDGETIVMPFGRYRRGATDATQYINTPIQTTANDLSIFVLTENVLFDKLAALPEGVCLLVGYIHDSIMLEVRDDYTEQVKAIVKDCMEHAPIESIGVGPIPVPLIADVEIAQTWG